MENENRHRNSTGPSSRYLSFSLGEESYAVPLLTIKEVIALPQVTAVPETPVYFLGLINLRGEIIPLIDLRKKLGIKHTNGRENSVIIFDMGTYSLSCVVDSVNSVLSPGHDEISPKPHIEGQKNTEYITGVYRKDDSLILLMDLTALLNLDEKKVVTSSLKAAA